MKISDEEVQAALNALFTDGDINETMRRGLEAAYTVRKARKAKKRAKAKPSILDEDQQKALRQAEQPEHRFKVGDRVVFAKGGVGTVTHISGVVSPYLVRFVKDGLPLRGFWRSNTELSLEPAAPEPKPEWNGKYDVGKAYRTRDGRRAEVSEIRVDVLWPIKGRVPGIVRPLSWGEDGGFDMYRIEHHLDLIGPWED